ncbi:MAG: trmD [Rickettsiaceae bacterium]|jgi:tRNA (guanine37-N1)-methyltransferase|nr:trmD [Rickettsiaceae bacterium]
MTDKPQLRVKIFTIFPEIFPGVLGMSIIGDALKEGIWELEVIDIRNFGIGARKTVDDTIFGGGSGMLMRADVLGAAIEANIKDFSATKIIYPSPRGQVFNQKTAIELGQIKELAIICGRYEGVDERVIEEYKIEEISIGDYVLSGGELPTMVMLDAVIRNLPGVLGDDLSLKEESFGSGAGSAFEKLLEYPHYTKPQIWKDRKVPEILLSGHHKNIDEWRIKEAIAITKKRRPELLNPPTNSK